MKQKILLCIKDYRAGIETNKDGLPFKSGAEFHAERHAQEMVRQGHEVTVFAKKQLWRMPNYEKIDGYGLHRLWPLIRAISLIGFLLSRYKNSDVLHIMGRPDFTAFAIPIARWLGILVSLEVTIVGEVFNEESRRQVWRHPIKAWRQEMFKRCDLFIANSQEMADDLLQHGISSEKIIRHPQGIDTTRFQPTDGVGKQSLRRNLGLPEQVLFLFCCRIVQRKGIDLLLDGWGMVQSRLKGCHLVIVGGGAPEWVQEINIAAQKHKNITYIPEVKDPVPYYQASDVYVFPSRKEGLPTSLMEAMACGLAPIVSGIGGNIDLVDDEELAGLRCKPESAEDLAGQISRLAEEASLREAIGNIARKKIEMEFERSDLVRQLLSYFETNKRSNKNLI